MVGFYEDEVDIASIGADVVPNTEVSDSGIKIYTLPAGKYVATIEERKLIKKADDAPYNAGRHIIKIRFKTQEGGKTVFCDVSWEPSTVKNGTDSLNELYSQIEQVLGLVGAPVMEVYEEMVNHAYLLELKETARCKVGQLLSQDQEWYLNERGLGETTEVTFNIFPGNEEGRKQLYRQGVKVQNRVKSIRKA